MPEATIPQNLDKLSYLMEQLQRRISILQSSVTRYRNRFYLSTMSTVFLSAIITVVAGWKPPFVVGAVNGTNVILALSAISTIISAWGAFFSPKETWVNYTTTLMRLRQLEAKLFFLTSGPNPITASSDAVSELFGEYQDILNAHNTAWREVRSSSYSGPMLNPTHSG
jgi:hypothetical protein